MQGCFRSRQSPLSPLQGRSSDPHLAPSRAPAHVIETVTLNVRLDQIRNRPHAARLLLAARCALLGLAAASAYALAPQPGAGESIYLRGVLPSGAPLEGKRQAAGLTARAPTPPASAATSAAGSAPTRGTTST